MITMVCNGVQIFFREPLTEAVYLVPMEEIVRAFNYVIAQGWVR